MRKERERRYRKDAFEYSKVVNLGDSAGKDSNGRLCQVGQAKVETLDFQGVQRFRSVQPVQGVLEVRDFLGFHSVPLVQVALWRQRVLADPVFPENLCCLDCRLVQEDLHGRAFLGLQEYLHFQ